MNLTSKLTRILCVFALCFNLGGVKAQFNDSILVQFDIDSGLVTADIFDIGLNGFLDPQLKESSGSTFTSTREGYFDHLEWLRRNSTVSIPSDSAVHAIKRAHFDQYDRIPISLSIVDFQYIDWQDEDSSIFDGSQQLVINSTNASKIQSATACQIAVFYPIIYQTSQKFILPSSLVFNNTETNISVAYEINNDGIYHDISFDQEFTLDFQGVSGIPQELIINFRIFKGVIALNRPFDVRVYPNSEEPDEVIYSNQLINACNIPFEFMPAEAQIKIKYSDPNFKSIRKPLIFIEGYDPDDDPLDNQYGLVNWATYQTGITYSENGKLVFQQLANLPNLVNSVIYQGYDLIIVDFKDPGARIEKNAMALIQIIQFVNASKTTNEENIVMGASMGGLIARYALRYMELHNCKHCTKAYLTFDTPHLGANIPHGVLDVTRAMYQHFGKAERQYLYQLNTPAVRQMLIYHSDETAYAERQAWQTKLDNMGHPVDCKRILMSSGHKNGNQYSINAGDLLLDWKISQERSFSVRTLFEVKVWSYDPNKKYYAIKAPVATYLTIGNNKIPTGVKILDYKVNRAFSNPYTMTNIDYCSGGSSEATGEVIDVLKANQASIWQQLSKIPNKHHVQPYGIRNQSFVSVASAIGITGQGHQINLANFILNNNAFESRNNPYAEKDGNLAHIEIKQENIDAILASLGATVVYADLNLPNANSEKNYNFSAQTLALIPSFIVGANGKLQFNTDRKSAYGRLYDPKLNPVSGTWETSQCGPTRVEIQSQGNMLIGEDPSVANYVATVKFLENSTLELQSDAVLRIRDNSTLIIEEGATLIYHPGAKIYLEGENAVLEIRGNLRLENNAVFSFEKGNGAKGGFVRFNLSDINANHIQAMGPNCKISLLGEIFFQDKVLEIAGATKLILPYQLNTNGIPLAEFRVVDGVIAYEGTGSLDAGCATYLKNVDFLQSIDKVGVGLITHGQANLLVEDCRFENFMLGMQALNNDLGNNLSITNNRFFNCSDGLHIVGGNVVIEQGSISTCGFGLRLESTQDAVIKEFEFLYNSFGIETIGNNPHVRIEDSWFLRNNSYGIFDIQETRFTIECTPFEENETGIYTNGQVNMSPFYIFPGQTLGGGNNTFFNNPIAMEFQTGEIRLMSGGNNFIMPAGNGTVPNFLIGSLTANASYIPNNLLDASGNYFSNLPLSGIGAGSGTLYSLTSFGGISPNGAPVFLNGAVLGSMNTQCFNFPRIYPDSKKAYDFNPEEYDFTTDKSLSMLKAFPNPSNNLVTLEGISTVSDVRDLILYDIQGKEIYRTKWAIIAGTNRIQLSLKDITEPGVYLLKVVGSDGASQVIRISLSY